MLNLNKKCSMKKHYFYITVGLFSFNFLTLSLFSCTSASEDDLIEEVPVTEFVTYEEHIKPIVANNCLFCHSNPPVNGAPMQLETYGAVKGAIENLNLIGRISSDDPSFRMPLGGQPLPQQSIDLFIQWQADGFQEE